MKVLIAHKADPNIQDGTASDKYGNVTAKSLYDYLKPSVEDTARRQNREQIPMLMPDNPQAGAIRLK